MTNHLFDGLLTRVRDPDRRFATIPGTPERHYSYGDLDRVSARFAHRLVGMGVEPGDRVAAQVPKSIEALVLYLAVVRAGAIFLPLNTAYTPGEVAYFLGNAIPRVFLCDPGDEAALRPVAEEAGARLETMGVWRDPDTFAGTFLTEGGESETFDTVARGADDLAAFLYTSGTTGRSKGAMLTHDNLLSNSATLAEHWRFTPDDVLLHALPIFHTHGLFVATNVTLLAGGSLIFLPKFDVDTLIEWMPKATAMMGVPTFYTRLLEDARFTREVAADMRLFVSGSAPLLEETHDRFERRTGHRILERYGMTETNMNTSNPYDGERRAGTVGFPLPGVELKITDPDTGAEVADGEVGQIEVRGPYVFKGYWQMPEKTAAELREDGFFITGDLARRDADGYVQIVGRNKDLIISGGYNIYPKEVELVLDAQPGVLESAVIGVPHPDFGETVVALIVPEPGETPEFDAIAAAAGEALARFKQPRRLILVDELPRNTMGKVQKNILRETYAGLFAEVG
jgi:malonyl-CoA/methylmalonyl-CoA synthetase